MPATRYRTRPARRRRRLMLGLIAALAGLLLSGVGLVATAPSASAATQGAGFGTWAPLSALGWHGSMIVNGVHTYCILPGLPAPTGESVDQGIHGEATGMSAQQLAGINHLVSTHGQTGDPVRSAAVGWAVKAIANRDVTLHAWGYPGDSLAGAVHWTFDRLAPEHAASVAALAEQYAAEAAAVVVPGSDGAIALTTDAADARRGTVRLSGGAGTIATVSLTHAVFADTGLPDRTQVDSGVDLPIIAAPPPGDGRPYTVRATGRFAAAIAPAIRYVTTAGQQSTAGPGGSVDYVVEAADAAPRPVVFAPGITTQVVSSETTSGPYVDEVAVAAVEGVWPRATDGSAVSLRAVAVVYRTEQPPISSTEVPADAVAVGELTLVTDPALGAGTYRVASTWDLPGPGYYTAVWRIAAADQEPSVAAHLERDYVWAEQFATPTQVTHVPEPPTPNAAPPELALTGPSDDLHRVAGFGLIALLLGGGFLGHHAQQRRRTTV